MGQDYLTTPEEETDELKLDKENEKVYFRL